MICRVNLNKWQIINKMCRQRICAHSLTLRSQKNETHLFYTSFPMEWITWYYTLINRILTTVFEVGIQVIKLPMKLISRKTFWRYPITFASPSRTWIILVIVICKEKKNIITRNLRYFWEYLVFTFYLHLL